MCDPDLFYTFVSVTMDSAVLPLSFYTSMARLDRTCRSILRRFIRQKLIFREDMARKYANRLLSRKYPTAVREHNYVRAIDDLETDGCSIEVPGTFRPLGTFVRLMRMTFICTRPCRFYMIVFGVGLNPIYTRVGDHWWDTQSGLDTIMDRRHHHATNPPNGTDTVSVLLNKNGVVGRYVTHVTFDVKHCVRADTHNCLSFIVTRAPPGDENVLLDSELMSALFTHLIANMVHS